MLISRRLDAVAASASKSHAEVNCLIGLLGVGRKVKDRVAKGFQNDIKAAISRLSIPISYPGLLLFSKRKALMRRWLISRAKSGLVFFCLWLVRHNGGGME
jgi:hypothetical protein